MTKKASAGWGAVGIDLETVRGEIFACVKRAGERGLTCEEVEDRLCLPHQTTSARISELAYSRVIVDTGEKRFTRSGRRARVYKVSAHVEVFDSPRVKSFDTETARIRPGRLAPPHASQAW